MMGAVLGETTPALGPAAPRCAHAVTSGSGSRLMTPGKLGSDLGAACVTGSIFNLPIDTDDLSASISPRGRGVNVGIPSADCMMSWAHPIVMLGTLTLARTGRGVVQPPTLRFFADSKKTAARSAARFWDTLWGKPCAIFGKKI